MRDFCDPAIDPELRAQFWRAAGKENIAKLKVRAQRFMTSFCRTEDFYEESGQFLPLSVWKEQGWPVDLILKNTRPEDRRMSAQGGETFRVRILQQGTRGVKGQVQERKEAACDRKRQRLLMAAAAAVPAAPVPASSSGLPASSSSSGLPAASSSGLPSTSDDLEQEASSASSSTSRSSSSSSDSILWACGRVDWGPSRQPLTAQLSPRPRHRARTGAHKRDSMRVRIAPRVMARKRRRRARSPRRKTRRRRKSQRRRRRRRRALVPPRFSSRWPGMLRRRRKRWPG